jgi:hypothetical protein
LRVGCQALFHDLFDSSAEFLFQVLAGFLEDEVLKDSVTAGFQFLTIGVECGGIFEGFFFFRGVCSED